MTRHSPVPASEGRHVSCESVSRRSDTALRSLWPRAVAYDRRALRGVRLPEPSARVGGRSHRGRADQTPTYHLMSVLDQCRKRKAKCSRTPQCSMCTARGVVCTWAPGTGPSRTSEEADLAACEAEVTRLSKLNAQLTLRIQQLEEEVVNAIRRERSWAEWREGYSRDRGFPQQQQGSRDFPPRPTSPQSMRSYHPSGPPYPPTGASTRRRSMSPPSHVSRQPSVPLATSPRQSSHPQPSQQNRPLYRSEPDSKPNLAQYERPAASGFVSPRVPRMSYGGSRGSGPDASSRQPEASKSVTPRREDVRSGSNEREHSPVSTSLEQAAHLSLAALRNHNPSAESAAVTLPRLQMDAPPSASRAYLGPSNSSGETLNVRSYGMKRQGSDPWQYRVSPSSLPQWAKPQASSTRSTPTTIETSAERERTQSYPQSMTSSTSPRSNHFESTDASSRSRSSSGPSTCATSTDKMDVESDNPEEEPDVSIFSRLDRAPSA
ncbi:BQ2448_2437 [Microbotryum intermedium]|uniref:BQ2448_2437 protein n=1 Tax=Microbotryum intermedium TaxID=269621 RepID=A0A238F8E8_9BASI|nr:BQ2448_2437 [Microbotryum intermedium]